MHPEYFLLIFLFWIWMYPWTSSAKLFAEQKGQLEWAVLTECKHTHRTSVNTATASLEWSDNTFLFLYKWNVSTPVITSYWNHIWSAGSAAVLVFSLHCSPLIRTWSTRKIWTINKLCLSSECGCIYVQLHHNLRPNKNLYVRVFWLNLWFPSNPSNTISVYCKPVNSVQLNLGVCRAACGIFHVSETSVTWALFEVMCCCTAYCMQDWQESSLCSSPAAADLSKDIPATRILLMCLVHQLPLAHI